MSDPADADDLPPPPPRPDPADCCGGGCAPCILDYYEEALERWRRQVAEIQARRQGQNGLSSRDRSADTD